MNGIIGGITSGALEFIIGVFIDRPDILRYYALGLGAFMVLLIVFFAGSDKHGKKGWALLLVLLLVSPLILKVGGLT